MEIQKTIEFATKAHGDQKRKYTGEPYIVHPISVSKRIEDLGIDGDILHAAILHDVVEDTPITLEEIRQEFGDSIANIVEELTDVYTSVNFPDLNRKARKKLEIERLSKISEQAQTIKLSDIIDNLPSIMEGDPGFGMVYIQEKIGIVNVLTKGDERLRKKALEMIEKYSK
jgi:(p)ppGpp synthase/HD superfamily hydrolase